MAAQASNAPLALTCSKLYADLPFAHRQASHGGHCRFVHGHNWAFRFTFAAKERDACGFVVDFGSLGPLKEWLETMFDHTLVVAEDDPERTRWMAMEVAGLADLRFVPDPSCEGLAAFVLEKGNRIVEIMTDGRARVLQVEVFEDSKNSATAYLQNPFGGGSE